MKKICWSSQWEIKKREGMEETAGAELKEVWENRQGRAVRLMWRQRINPTYLFKLCRKLHLVTGKYLCEVELS